MSGTPTHNTAPLPLSPEAAFRANVLEAYRKAPFQFDWEAAEYGQRPIDGNPGHADLATKADDKDESILRFEKSFDTTPIRYVGKILGHDEFTLSLCAIKGGPRSVLEAEFSDSPLVMTTYVGFPDEPGEGSMARVFMAPDMPHVAVRMSDLYDAQQRSLEADGHYLDWDGPRILSFVDRSKMEILSPDACLALGEAIATAEAKLEVHHYYEPQQGAAAEDY